MQHQAPDFLIVGTQKGGTSSLYNCLNQHPDILAANKKEIHYFSMYYNRGADWYLGHFPKRDDNQLSGEASPFYLFHPQSAKRIAATFPQIKIIIMLRNPVHRAISHYHQQYRREHEKLTMKEAFEQEPQRIKAGWKKMLNDEQVSGSKVQQCSYLKRGEYLEQVERYEVHFPAEQIYLSSSEAFFSDPAAELQKIFTFLTLDNSFVPEDLWPRKPGNYGDTEPEMIDFLTDYFKPHNEALFAHLGRQFDWL